MTSEVKTTPIAPRSGVIPYRLTVEQFEAMIDAGVFPGHVRVELLGGLLVRRMTKNNPHDFAVSTLAELLRNLLGPGHHVREEKSIRLGPWSRPEPDVAVVRGPREAYRARGPRDADVLLVAEVADSTYTKDRGRMWRLYAGAGVPVYWVVNLPARQIEVYTGPAGEGKAAAYREAAVFAADAEAPVVIEGREVGTVRVQELLP